MTKYVGSKGLSAFALFLLMTALLKAPAYALDPGKAITQYVQTTWTVQSGLPQNSVHALAQTPDGYLWFGTEEGLVRFDGLHFKVFDDRNTKGLPDSFVTRLLVTHDGTLWVATRNAVSQYRAGVIRTYTAANGLLEFDITGLCEGNDGTVWIATSGGLNRLKDNKISSFTERDGLPDKNITAIAQTQNGAIWLGTSRGLARFWNGKFSLFGVRNRLPGGKVEALAASRDGSLWVATLTGLARWRNSQASPVASVVVPMTDHVQDLVEDRDGNLWVAWTRRGLTRVSSGGVANYSHADGLPENNISALFQDLEGNIWVGTSDSGLAELRDGKFTGFGKPEGLSSDALWSVLESRNGAIWVGTDDGGIDEIRGGKVTRYTTGQGLPTNNVNGIFEARDGSLWAGSEDGWISRINNGKVTKYRDPASKSARVVAIENGPGESLWVGFHEPDGLAQMQNGRFKHYAVPGLINTLYKSHDGALWIGTDRGGVSRFENGRVIKTYTKKDGLLSNFAQAIYEDRQGSVWIGTSPGGLSRIKSGKITAFSMDQGLFNETVGAIVEDDSGYLWMTCNKGIFKVSKQELNDYADGRVSSIHSIVYGIADGMRSPECDFGATPSAWKSRDGRLRFATNAGVAMIDPNHIGASKRAPSVLMETVVLNQKPVPIQSGMQLGPGAGRLELQFSAPSFIAPDRMRFRYKLAGFESEWNDPGSTRTATYTNLASGKYRFSVQAANSDGVWSTGQSHVDFEICAHFYQTAWFRALCVLIFVYFARTIYSLRMRYLVNRNQELGSRVAERTAELENALKAGEVARDALRELATRDGLTGLWNRHSIFEILEQELARAARERIPVSVLMADLDYFKSVNDTYGHMGGDAVLREAANRIGGLMRPYDSAGRYGGEEIMIVLPNCSLADAENRAEELRLAIDRQQFCLAGRALSLTCSFGVACSHDEQESASLVSAADSALYAAKAAGRNRVEIFSLAGSDRLIMA